MTNTNPKNSQHLKDYDQEIKKYDKLLQATTCHMPKTTTHKYSVPEILECNLIYDLGMLEIINL